MSSKPNAWQRSAGGNFSVNLVVSLLILMMTCGFSQDNLVSAEAHPEYVANELLVKFKSEVSTQSVSTMLQSMGLEEIRTIDELNVRVCRITSGRSVEQMIADAEGNDDLEYCEPNYILHILDTNPNDSRYNEQYALHNTGQSGGTPDADIDAPAAWDTQTGNHGIIVAIIDTGIDDGHPDLQANMWRNPGESGNGKESNGVDDDGNGFIDDYRGWDFANNDNNPFDDNNHGTHCAGIVGAVGNNSQGVSGANWNVSLVGLKFLTGSGSGSTSDAVEAILYAGQMGFDILSNSWGGGGSSQTLENAIRNVHNRGILFIAAAGNDSKNTDNSANYPSNYDVPNVISVASSDNRDQLSGFSNYGKSTVDLAAPGSNILSTVANGGYRSFSGTSMATPYVSGVAALASAQFPGINHIDLKYRIMGSVDVKASFNNRSITEGRLNAANALSRNPLVTTIERASTNNTTTPYTITAFAVDDNGIASVELTYTVNGGAASTVNMSGTTQQYTGAIPAQALNSTINYFVKATDTQGNETQGRTLSFQVTSNPPDDGGGGGGICGAFAVTIDTDNPVMDSVATLAINLMLLLMIPLYIYRRIRK